MKMHEFRLSCHWRLSLNLQLTIFQHWFRKCIGVDQATGHYLNQSWLVYWRIYASLGRSELKCILAEEGDKLGGIWNYIHGTTNNITKNITGTKWGGGGGGGGGGCSHEYLTYYVQNVFYNIMTTFNTNVVQWASCQIRKIAGAHAPGMPGTFSPSPQVNDPDMHHGTCVTHVPWCMPGSLTSGLLWNRRRGKTFSAFMAHAQPAILRIW